MSGKKPMGGMKYSFLRAHFNPTAKRKFYVNLQPVKTKINGRKVTLKVAASYIKAHPEIRTGIDLPLKKRSRKKLKKLLASLSKQ